MSRVIKTIKVLESNPDFRLNHTPKMDDMHSVSLAFTWTLA